MQVTKKQVHNAIRVPQNTLRRHVTDAFQAMAHAIDERSAFARTKAFYRLGGWAWARALS